MLRNILKKVWVVCGKEPLVNTEDVQKAFNSRAGRVYSIEEVECLVGNLVLKGFVRGYVFPEEKKIALSKGNGFPAISKMAGN